MANEARLQLSLRIQQAAGTYQSQPTSFNANVSTFNGPTPGTILVGLHGTDISLSQLVNPGLIWIGNLDTINPVDIGIYDVRMKRFYPMIRLLAAEYYIWRMSPFYSEEYGTGSGTGSGFVSPGNTLRAKAYVAPVRLRVEAFDS